MTILLQPHDNWKVMLLRGELHADHVERFVLRNGIFSSGAGDDTVRNMYHGTFNQD